MKKCDIMFAVVRYVSGKKFKVRACENFIDSRLLNIYKNPIYVSFIYR